MRAGFGGMANGGQLIPIGPIALGPKAAAAAASAGDIG